MNPDMLINASNLHIGGGLQVATSVIGELTCMPDLPSGLVVWASDAVDANLRLLGYDPSLLPAYEVINSYGLKLLVSPLVKRLQTFSSVFTIFGPLYVWKLSGINITGFAQAWIMHPNIDIELDVSWSQRWLKRLKFGLQAKFFRRADQLVVELNHVRSGLLRLGIGSSSSIHVIPNSLSSLYISANCLNSDGIAVIVGDADIKLGFVGRNYLHKNTRIFPAVIDQLRREHGIKASIYVTFTGEEWSKCSKEFRAKVTNVGPLLVAQCPSFYRQMDGVIFPSLLECFSATPLEAMAMEKPLFASDRPFNRDICGDHAHYFDPLSPETAAQAIAQLFLNGGPNPEDLRAARDHAINFSSPKARAEQYLALLMQAANNTCNKLKRT